MKILLINTKTFYVTHMSVMPLGLLSIATYLKENGHTVKVIDRDADKGSFKKNSFCPDIVGIAVPSYESFPDAVKVSKIYKRMNIPVVWGGQMPSLIPDIVMKSGFVDYLILGEGEITFLALLEAIEKKQTLHDIDGLAFIENDKIVINKDREFADLAQLPITDFSFIKPEKYFVPYIGCDRMLHIYASKGCPYQCSYCYCQCLHKGVWRPRPSQHFLNEIKYLVKNHKMDGVCFVDDLFGPNKDYVKSLCEEIIKSGIVFAWGCNMRADTCTKEELQIMHDAGCRWILFGIESGSTERQQKIKKKINFEKAKATLIYCKEIGIFTTATFIIGLPEETEEELKQTLEFIKEIDANAKFPNFCGVIPKTDLSEYLIKKDLWQPPQSWKEYARFRMMDKLGDNYSQLSNKDLKIISACFYWVNLFVKYPKSGKNRMVLANRAISQIFDAFRRGSLYSMMLVFLSAKEFIGILYYAKMFPKIRKKYGLDKSSKKL